MATLNYVTWVEAYVLRVDLDPCSEFYSTMLLHSDYPLRRTNNKTESDSYEFTSVVLSERARQIIVSLSHVVNGRLRTVCFVAGRQFTQRTTVCCIVKVNIAQHNGYGHVFTSVVLWELRQDTTNRSVNRVNCLLPRKQFVLGEGNLFGRDKKNKTRQT